MAQETLNRIREAELNAERILEDARTSGAELIAKAQADAQQYRDDLIAKYRADAKDALDKTEAGLDSELEKAQTRAEAVIAQLGRTVDSRKDSAIRMVVNSLI